MLRNLILTLSILLLALLAVPVLAGGWAVITLDSLPGEVRAGEEVDIGFMIRGHGRTPVDGATPSLLALNRDTGERLHVEATQSEKPGHYTAAVTFPEAGVWQWEINAAPYPQRLELAPLTVLPTAAVPAEATVTAPALITTLRLFLRVAALALLALAGVMVLRQHRASNARTVPSTGD